MTKANLIELVADQELTSKYSFWDNQDIELLKQKQNKLEINLITYDSTIFKYSKFLSYGKLRNVLCNALENNSTNMDDLNVIPKDFSPINELDSVTERTKNFLGNLKFSNRHNPLRKNYWNVKNILGAEGQIILDTLFIGGTVGGIFLDPLFFTLPLWGVCMEGIAYAGKLAQTEHLREFDKCREDYNNFRDNIQNAKVNVVFSREAYERVNVLKNLEEMSSLFDINKVNDYLKMVYSKYI